MNGHEHVPTWWQFVAPIVSGVFGWLFPSPLKKGKNMKDIIAIGLKVVAALWMLMMAVEIELGEGTGDEKKAKVLALVKEKLPAILDGAVPAAILSVFMNDVLLGMVIDMLVSLANKQGAFVKVAPANP